MPLAEIANALLVTFIATEYQFRSEDRYNLFLSRATRIALLLVAAINVIERVSGVSVFLQELLYDMYHIPKILLAAGAYVAALYVDCRRSLSSLTLRAFVAKVALAFMKVAPWYPFLAVLISFGFLFVISIWEALHLPLGYLNMPIYYGTLYGPFSMVYFNVKKKIIEEKNSLPFAHLQRQK
jgi:hypothetical protein